MLLQIVEESLDNHICAGVPSEVYRIYEDIVAPVLTEALKHRHDKGELPETMMHGDVALIYKKKDPKDIRNYRPITLLNVDYKVLAIGQIRIQELLGKKVPLDEEEARQLERTQLPHGAWADHGGQLTHILPTEILGATNDGAGQNNGLA